MREKWYALSMDEGLIAIASKKTDLLNHYICSNGKCKRVRKGQYEINQVSGFNESTLYIYHGLELALKNGWREAIKEYEECNDDEKEVIIL